MSVLSSPLKTQYSPDVSEDRNLKKGWQSPRGGVDPEETEKADIRRELQEKTGLEKIKKRQVSKKRVKFEFHQWARGERTIACL